MIGKTVLVTGAAKRVGRAISGELHAAGANVMIHYREAQADAVALAVELAPEVRVNAVAPGPIIWPQDGFDDARRASIVDHTLLKRTGSPQDIARAVLFLLAEATYVTGQVLNVDGGRTAHL